MQSDPWWSLAMAINVFLVFYFRASPDSFRKWWWLYCMICYGGPFVIALSLLLVRHKDRGLVYGEATVSILDGNLGQERGLVNSQVRSGAGWTANGTTYASTPTTCSSGSASLAPSCYTSWLATTSSGPGTSCAASPPRLRTATLRMPKRSTTSVATFSLDIFLTP